MSVFDFLKFKPQPQQAFTIYTNDVTDNANNADVSEFEAISFTSMLNFNYNNQVIVANEPLENSQFASDSVQDSAYTLLITAKSAPIVTGLSYTYKDTQNLLNQTVTDLKDYLHSQTLLTILMRRPLFDFYTDIKLTGFNYELSNQNTVLTAYMTFQEIRSVTTEYGGLKASQVSDPTYASSVDRGQVQTNNAYSSPTLERP